MQSKINYNIVSISKIREKYQNFKSECDTFSINYTEFEQIFGNFEAEFALWDTDKNNLIDSLELFTGLIIYSDCNIEEKLKCKIN